MPLQGVWTADEGKLPPWKGDYHGDLNTQFSYYNFLKSDHLEEGESFLDFMWNLNDQANAFAKSFFDADGLCLPSVFAFDGTSLGGWPMYSTNITNQIWQDHIFYLYYKYTGDESFLRERLYPYLKGIEAVVRRHLIRDAAGKYTLPLTSSPEIHNNELDAWLDSLSNYDLALLRFLYEALIEFAPAVCPEDLPVWEDIYRDLPEFAVNESGFMITAKESLQESHRHLSHLMAVFPLDQCQYDRSSEERKCINDSIHTLERFGRGEWVGFSFTWMAEIYARVHNGEGAVYQLRGFFEHLCSQNGFHLNGDFRHTGITASHYRPFTLESNMCAADAIQEMLMQCYDGTIRVFPAIPATWSETGCEFDGFLSYGGIKVSSAIENNKVCYIRLNPKKDTVCRIVNPFGCEQVQVQTGDFIDTLSGDTLTLSLKAGSEYLLRSC
jgi:alpha-L-fucosidase 2